MSVIPIYTNIRYYASRIYRRSTLMITFNNLWNVMKQKNISQYKLINNYNISPSQLTRLKRNESVSTNTIDKFCQILDCDISDIMEFKK